MFGNKSEDKRFEVICEQSVNMIGITVIRDKETGVNYILSQGVNGLAITPLLDEYGEVTVTK